MREVAHLDLVCVQRVESAVQHLDTDLRICNLIGQLCCNSRPANARQTQKLTNLGSKWPGIHQALRTAVDTRMPSVCTPRQCAIALSDPQLTSLAVGEQLT